MKLIYKFYKIWIFFFLMPLCYAQNDTVPVRKKDILDVIYKIFHKNDTLIKKRDKKIAFSLLPAPVNVNSNSGLVISFLTTFYLGDSETTKMSQISFAPYFSFTNQYVFPIQSYIYTKDNEWSFIGDYRFLIYPQPTYGLGNHSIDEEMSTLNYQQWRFYQFVTRKIKGNFQLGLGLLFDNYQNITEESNIEAETDYSRYMNGDFNDASSFGFAVQALYDSRKNNINPDQGLLLKRILDSIPVE